MLAATDPANPYGVELAWPAGVEGAPRPGRTAEALVVLDGGPPTLYLSPGRSASTFGSSARLLERAARAVADLVREGRVESLLVERADGLPRHPQGSASATLRIMVEPVIRRMRRHDMDAVVTVSLAADTLFARAGLDLPPDDPREMLDHVEHVLVAEVDGSVVGLAATITLDGATHLEQLAVDPEHGRRGIGGALLERVCADAAAHGHDRVTLTTFRDLPWNGPWYERRGFVTLPRAAWGPDLVRQWKIEEDAGILVRPRVAMWREPSRSRDTPTPPI